MKQQPRLLEEDEFKVIRDAILEADLPDLKAIVTSFFRQIGGPDQFAKMLSVIVKKSPESRVGMMVMQMMIQASKVLIDKEKKSDMEHLTDDDLESELQRLVSKAARDTIRTSDHPHGRAARQPGNPTEAAVDGTATADGNDGVAAIAAEAAAPEGVEDSQEAEESQGA